MTQISIIILEPGAWIPNGQASPELVRLRELVPGTGHHCICLKMHCLPSPLSHKGPKVSEKQSPPKGIAVHEYCSRLCFRVHGPCSGSTKYLFSSCISELNVPETTRTSECKTVKPAVKEQKYSCMDSLDRTHARTHAHTHEIHKQMSGNVFCYNSKSSRAVETA
jgi:hypothetical protein